MQRKNISRREFIKVTSTSTAAIALGTNFIRCDSSLHYDSKGLPTRTLGKTGIQIPLIAFGTGSRWCSIEDEDKALNILTYALDNGLFYWDTAHIYTKGSVISEERLGTILKHRRKEVFLSTKCATRNPDEAKKAIETSLTRLQTDHVDILKIHHIENEDDLAVATKKGGLYDVLLSMKEQGITRFIGFSGHRSDVTMARAATDFDFDTMLVSLNHYSDDGDNFEETAVSAAANKNMGIMVMKVIRPRETVKSVIPSDLIKYALSLKNVHGAVIGIDSMEVLKDNLELVRSFQPLSSVKMSEISASLSPFYKSMELQWMQNMYRDGMWG